MGLNEAARQLAERVSEGRTEQDRDNAWDVACRGSLTAAMNAAAHALISANLPGTRTDRQGQRGPGLRVADLHADVWFQRVGDEAVLMWTHSGETQTAGPGAPIHPHVDRAWAQGQLQLWMDRSGRPTAVPG